MRRECREALHERAYQLMREQGLRRRMSAAALATRRTGVPVKPGRFLIGVNGMEALSDLGRQRRSRQLAANLNPSVLNPAVIMARSKLFC